MPLFKSKSKKAFSHNVKAEIDAGKPQKQAVAIAYSVLRRARKMAQGGKVVFDGKLSAEPKDRFAEGGQVARHLEDAERSMERALKEHLLEEHLESEDHENHKKLARKLLGKK